MIFDAYFIWKRYFCWDELPLAFSRGSLLRANWYENHLLIVISAQAKIHIQVASEIMKYLQFHVLKAKFVATWFKNRLTSLKDYKNSVYLRGEKIYNLNVTVFFLFMSTSKCLTNIHIFPQASVSSAFAVRAKSRHVFPHSENPFPGNLLTPSITGHQWDVYFPTPCCWLCCGWFNK